MRAFTAIVLLLSVLLLPACSGMNEQACLVTDWRSVGFEDGIAGRSAGSIGNFRQACSKHGVSPDLAEYRAGHAEGVSIFCRASNGFEVGRRGSRYAGVCPAELEPEFLAAFSDGRQLYEFESAVRSLTNQIAARHHRREELTKQLASASAEIIADETGTERRTELVIGMAAMAKERDEIGDEIEELEAELALREADLYAYRETIAFVF